MSGNEHLVQMANDIGHFFQAQPRREDAVAGIANHIASYWTKRMREKLLASLAEGAKGLDDLPLEAIRRLSPAKSPAISPAKVTPAP